VQLGRPREARHRLDSAFERLQQMKLYPAEKIKPGAEAEVALSALADYQARTGNIAGAIEIYQRLLQGLFAWGAKPDINLEDALDVSHVYATLASLLQRAHQSELASAVAAQRLQLWRNWNAQLPQNSFVGRQLNSAIGPIQ
jgi:site-specific recombinase XerC